MIRRTNAWIGGSNGDASPPPRSPDQTMPIRRLAAPDETGEEAPNTITTTTATTRPLGNSVASFVDEESNVFSSSSVVLSGDDSLLTTSMETDSLFQSEISDNEAARTCHVEHWNSAPPNDNERRTNDVTSCADSPENDVSSPRSGGLSLPLFGCHNKDTVVTDCEGNRLSIEAVVNDSEQTNRKRLRRSPESNSDWKRRPSSAEEGGRISELFPRSCDIRTKAATTPDKIRDNDNETQANPTCQQRRQLVTESEEREADLIERCDADQLFAASSDQLRRKILAIRSSLQDKVTLLKHEKKVVDRKIREAKEEERLRLRQLEIFRQHLSQTRKELLQRTLEEVKKQLSQQALRLQSVYDRVLVEQRQLVCCY